MLIGTSKQLAFKWLVALPGLVFYPIAHAELLIENAWVKLAPPGATANAGYLKIKNTGVNDVVIESLSASCCKELMLHRTHFENDKAVMEHLNQVVVPAGEQVTFEPGGLHVMLSGAKKPLALNDEIDLTLHCSDGQQVTIHVPVKNNDY